MTLFSPSFLIFLAVTALLYYLLPLKKRWILLLAANFVFYFAAGGAGGFLFLAITVLSTWFCARRIDDVQTAHAARVKDKEHPMTKEEKKAAKERTKQLSKRIMLAGVLLNFGILGVLKYAGLFVSGARFILPLGISFYTFQSMGYLIDVSKGKYSAERNPFRYALYAGWFPQMIEGPIGRFDKLAPQLFEGHELDPIRFREGLLRILWGFFKKLVIADQCAIVVAEVFNNYRGNGYTGLVVFIGVLMYGAQMYGDFSGGIDIVIGVAELFGVTMQENFRQPIFSKTVSEFWQRWHISLGNWMRDYVFYPMALSKRFSKIQKWMRTKIGPYYGKFLPTCFVSFLVFVLVGVWHGAEKRYVLFGVYHAIMVSQNTLLEKKYENILTKLRIDFHSVSYQIFQMARTLFFITIGRYLDRASSVRQALDMLRATFTSWNPWVLTDGTLYRLGLSREMVFLILFLLVLVFAVDALNEYADIKVRSVIARQGFVARVLVYAAAVAVILLAGAYGPGFDASTFLYQQF